MSETERIQVDCRMDNLALGKKIRRFAPDSCFARSHRTRNDQQRFRRPSNDLLSFIFSCFPPPARRQRTVNLSRLGAVLPLTGFAKLVA